MQNDDIEIYAKRLAEVQHRIDDAATKADRDAGEITLIVVTKFHTADVVRKLHDCGVRNFGENRHQEAEPKALETSELDLNWHFVGQLQSKKARAAARYAKTIHSLDRSSVITVLSKIEDVIDGFLQINLTDNPGRGGVEPTEIETTVEQILNTNTINFRGIMSVAPLGEKPESAFERLAEYSEKVRRLAPNATDISAGMSHDFEEAIQFGATHLRIGSLITGERPKTG
ncbi:MAG TPA: YggS family pyridoxal phosphate-dependent enzyme [Microbacteriaceae bacterium]|nr:YggS family pyridoxal phosphate-dependent enzyme [Microbacteriaceae bacterium]